MSTIPETDPVAQPEEGQSPAERRRKFALGDLMILTAAPIFLLMVRKHIGREEIFLMFLQWGIFHNPRMALWPVYLAPFLVLGSLAFVAVRLVPPRTRFVDLLTQPGFVGNWAISMFSFFQALHVYADLSRANLTLSYPQSFQFYSVESWAGGSIVIATWITLVLTGAWRPRKNWLDRAGRAWCILWIIVLMYDYFMAWMRFV